MTVRRATIDDVDHITALLEAFHAESSFSGVSYSRSILKENLTRAIPMDIACALVAEQDGSIVGFLLGHHGRYFFSEESAAWEEFVYVAPQARGTAAGRALIRRFLAWAGERGASNVHLGINAGIDARRSGLFVERLGFVKTGDVFVFKVGASG